MRIYIIAFALGVSCINGSALAKCLSEVSDDQECRYPQGDSWCAQHGQGYRYAYSDNCLESKSTSSDVRTDSIEWISFDELDRASEHLISLSEDESVKSLSFAHVRLQQATPAGKTDSLLIYNYNQGMCGSAGCSLAILTRSNGVMQEIMDIAVQEDGETEDILYPAFSLGEQYTNGMRNLRFYNKVTWVWNGSKYELK